MRLSVQHLSDYITRVMRRRALDIEAIMENLCRTQFGFLIEQQYHELGGLNATMGVVPISRFRSRQRFETHNVDQRSPLLKNYHRRGPCILQYILRDDFVVDGLGIYHGLHPPTVHRGQNHCPPLQELGINLRMGLHAGKL
ncbi:hypothetical protein Ancab_001293 [Ancistrocladus abbreviatus]